MFLSYLYNLEIIFKKERFWLEGEKGLGVGFIVRVVVGRSKNVSNIWVVSFFKGEGCRGVVEEFFLVVWGYLLYFK